MFVLKLIKVGYLGKSNSFKEISYFYKWKKIYIFIINTILIVIRML